MSYGWGSYVPVAKRLANARMQMDRLRAKGQNIQAIEIEGRKISRTFWGKAWCSHLESFSDYANRLPRGRTYVRNGSVCHLEIEKGQVTAMVVGSEIYHVDIKIKALTKEHWQAIQQQCAGDVGTLLELLQGKLSDNVMQAVTDTASGLFPLPENISLNCDCPDWATMCKHVAAVLYGVGARLDHSPELLFVLRDVNHMDLVNESEFSLPSAGIEKPKVSGDLADIFGIDLDTSDTSESLLVPLEQAVSSRQVSKKAVSNKEVREVSDSRKKAKKPVVKKSASKGQRKMLATKQKVESEINISRGIRASHIKTLRNNFAMSETEFSQLIGCSLATLRKWTEKKGLLKLQRRSQEALTTAFQMDKKQAWKQLM